MKTTLRKLMRGRSPRRVFITLLVGATLLAPAYITGLGTHAVLEPSVAQASSTVVAPPFSYTFNSTGSVSDAASSDLSSSPYFWLVSGGRFTVGNGMGQTIQGSLSWSDPLRAYYANHAAVSSDNGAHPQNMFFMLTRGSIQNVAIQTYIRHTADNLANSANRQPYNGEMLIARYKDTNNYYIAGIRDDGSVVIKKKTKGSYQTLASTKLISGTYSSTNPDLIPKNTWIGLRFIVTDTASGAPALTLFTDVGKTGVWQQNLSVTDDTTTYGAPISGSGLVGIESDYADMQMSTLTVALAGSSSTTSTSTSSTSSPAPSPSTTSYDTAILADTPALFLSMTGGASGVERDASGNGHNGTYMGGTPSLAALPNGDQAADFNGSSEYVTVPSSPAFSIPTTGVLTWEAWIRPDTLQFPNASADGYADFLGKCADYSPTCEWEGRMYNAVTAESRPDRISGYVFNPSAGLGSGADWQPAANVIQAGKWLHVVVEYDTRTTPSACSSAYPGTISIWVNGVKQSFADHAPTGCMSQYSVTPKAGTSPLQIGTMALDTWFKGAIGKVAIYKYLLSQTQITNHFSRMTGTQPTGSCTDTCTF